ncbi:unnamed protein product [Notodromas monacha]|uniref:Uncharacterized protein n=1 Tax=Notodromas monacha TaxID=399045 RepID=A0A7R9BW31_9CRUS|nr:unnamed protein product [Notodromas monacha]CAG0921186.1 unnamed protein product [Notodromas monacha]
MNWCNRFDRHGSMMLLLLGAMVLLAALFQPSIAHRIAYDPLKDPDYWDGVSQMSPVERLAFKEYVQSKVNGARHMVIPEFVYAKLKAEASSSKTTKTTTLGPTLAASLSESTGIVPRNIRPSNLMVTMVDPAEFLKVTPDASKKSPKLVLRIGPESVSQLPEQEFKVLVTKVGGLESKMLSKVPAEKEFKLVDKLPEKEVKVVDKLPEQEFRLLSKYPDKELKLVTKSAVVPETTTAAGRPDVSNPMTRSSQTIQLSPMKFFMSYKSTPSSNINLSQIAKHFGNRLQNMCKPKTFVLPEAVMRNELPKTSTPVLRLTEEVTEVKTESSLATQRPSGKSMGLGKLSLINDSKPETDTPVQLLLSAMEKQFRTNKDSNKMLNNHLKNLYSLLGTSQTPSVQNMLKDVEAAFTTKPQMPLDVQTVSVNERDDSAKEDRLDPIIHMSQRTMDFMNELLKKRKFEFPEASPINSFSDDLRKDQQQSLMLQKMKDKMSAVLLKSGLFPELMPPSSSGVSRLGNSDFDMRKPLNVESSLMKLMRKEQKVPSMDPQPISNLLLLRNKGDNFLSSDANVLHAAPPAPLLAAAPLAPAVPFLQDPAALYPSMRNVLPLPSRSPVLIPPAPNPQLQPHQQPSMFQPGHEQGGLQYQEVQPSMATMETCPPGAVCAAALIKNNKWTQEQLSSYQNEDLNGVLTGDWAPQKSPPMDNLVFNPIPVYYRETGDTSVAGAEAPPSAAGSQPMVVPGEPPDDSIQSGNNEEDEPVPDFRPNRHSSDPENENSAFSKEQDKVDFMVYRKPKAKMQYSKVPKFLVEAL